MRRLLQLLPLLLTILAGSSAHAAGCPRAIHTPLQVLAVMEFDIYTPVKERHLPELACWAAAGGACRPIPVPRPVKVVEIYDAPGNGALLGLLVMHYKRLDKSIFDEAVFSFVEAGTNKVTPVEREMRAYANTEDGSFDILGQTLLDRRNGWSEITLPLPLARTGWVNLPDAMILSAQSGPVELLRPVPGIEGLGAEVIKFGGGRVTLRSADSPADGDISLPIAKLYDGACRLALMPLSSGC